MTVNVRFMLTKDVGAVYDIERKEQRSPWTYDILLGCVKVGYDCRVLEINKQIAGYTIGRYYADYCHILNICITQQYQNQGYGKFLLDYVLKSLLKPNIRVVHLEVRPSNQKAINLYKGLGFKEHSIKEGYYNDEDEKTENAIVLRKTL